MKDARGDALQFSFCGRPYYGLFKVKRAGPITTCEKPGKTAAQTATFFRDLVVEVLTFFALGEGIQFRNSGVCLNRGTY